MFSALEKLLNPRSQAMGEVLPPKKRHALVVFDGQHTHQIPPGLVVSDKQEKREDKQQLGAVDKRDDHAHASIFQKKREEKVGSGLVERKGCFVTACKAEKFNPSTRYIEVKKGCVASPAGKIS